MSLFDFDYSAVTNIVDPLSPVCGSNNTKSYELLGYPHLNASGPVFGADVIPADYDFSADLLEEPEHSMNLEEMIEAGVYLSEADCYQASSSGRQQSNNSNLPDEDSLMLPRTLAQHQPNNNHSDEYLMSANSPYSVSSPASSSNHSGTPHRRSGKSGKSLSKDSEEYKRRRALNNIAVKKSREKAKAESRITAQRLHVLSADKERLERRVEQLNKEIQFLHGLFSKFTDVPEPVRAEVGRAFARLQNHR